jgi:hypothetical protein
LCWRWWICGVAVSDESESLDEQEAEARLAAFEDYWRADRERRADPTSRERVDALRDEFRVLARRNWTKINAIHGDYATFNQQTRRVLRRVAIALAVLFVVQAVLGWETFKLLNEPVKGRRFALGLSCAVESAVGKAGHDVILAGAAGIGGRFERNLERLGYPPARVRLEQARSQAAVYVSAITNAVQGEVGGKGAKLIRPDGSLDCQRLIKLSNATR